jgi:hypothetical protein
MGSAPYLPGTNSLAHGLQKKVHFTYSLLTLYTQSLPPRTPFLFPVPGGVGAREPCVCLESRQGAPWVPGGLGLESGGLCMYATPSAPMALERAYLGRPSGKGGKGRMRC